MSTQQNQRRQLNQGRQSVQICLGTSGTLLGTLTYLRQRQRKKPKEIDLENNAENLIKPETPSRSSPTPHPDRYLV